MKASEFLWHWERKQLTRFSHIQTNIVLVWFANTFFCRIIARCGWAIFFTVWRLFWKPRIGFKQVDINIWHQFNTICILKDFLDIQKNFEPFFKLESRKTIYFQKLHHFQSSWRLNMLIDIREVSSGVNDWLDFGQFQAFLRLISCFHMCFKTRKKRQNSCVDLRR